MRFRDIILVAITLVVVGIGGPAASQCVDPPAGLTSWWTGDGTGSDIMGINDGALQGGMGFIPGKVDRAFALDGSDDYLVVDNVSLSLDFPFSVDFWIYKESSADFYGIAATDAKDNGLYSGFRVYVNAAGSVVSGIGNDEGCCAPEFRRNFFSPDGVVTLHAWHHIAVVFMSPTSHWIYVDGSVQATTQEGLATTMASGASSQLCIGRVFDPNVGAYQYGQGRIDELRIYSAILDTAAIQNIVAAGDRGPCRAAVATAPRSWSAIKVSFRGR
jgi:hypothetical protein